MKLSAKPLCQRKEEVLPLEAGSMAVLNGKEYTRKELLSKTGSIAQLCEVRPSVLSEGKSSGVKIYDMTTGSGLSCTVMADKGMDMFHLSYKGTNMCFHAKPGIVNASLADLYGMGAGFLRSIAGGMFYTCGLSNNGGACTDEGVDHVFNGRVRNIPAEKLASVSEWDGDEYRIGIKGEMRDTGLFCENLVLHREITSSLGAKSVKVSDTVRNEGFKDAYCMLMYHINLGFPLVDEDTRLLFPENQMTPLNPISERDAHEAEICTAPVPGADENAFVRKQAHDDYGYSMAAAYNDRLGLGLYVKYNVNEMPNLIEWKAMASGDYVVGLHVANSLFGRCDQKAAGALQSIPALEERHYGVEIGVIDGAEDLRKFTEELGKYHY